MREPSMGPMEQNPQRYYDFPYKMGAETWSTNYPVPGGLGTQFDINAINELGQSRDSPSAMEYGPLFWQKPEKKGFFGTLFSGINDETLLLLGPPPGIDDDVLLL